MTKQSYNLAIIFYSLSKLVCKINFSSHAWRLSHVLHDGWWRSDTIATELRLHAVATKKAQARYTKSMPSGISRPTIAHKTRLWARVGIVIQSQINLPAIPRGYDKKISLPRYVLRSSAIRQCLSHVLAY